MKFCESFHEGTVDFAKIIVIIMIIIVVIAAAAIIVVAVFSTLTSGWLGHLSDDQELQISSSSGTEESF